MRLAAVLALARAIARHLIWGQRLVSREIAEWQAQASTISDAQLRRHALVSLREKRDETYGAALFWTLPDTRHATLLRLLVAYQTMWDFLDTLSEDIAFLGDTNGRHLHRALVEALTPGGPISDYYSLYPGRDDGGYLHKLVETCQRECAGLPAYPRVRPLVLAGVARCSVQAINHAREPRRRELSLRQWAAQEFPGERSMPWFEVTAAAGAFIPHVLFALASEPDCTDEDIALAHATYFPWMSLAITMLDSYVDQQDDQSRGAHSYFAYYEDEQAAVTRLIVITRTLMCQLYGLRAGGRHATLGSCMIAMYLSKVPARTPGSRISTERIIHECDSLTRLVLPVLQIWRICRAIACSQMTHRPAKRRTALPDPEVGRC
jgi:tetraprenyl-beta-curcumene synthase